ncbi:MAG: carbohydrate kinase family protein [Thermoflexales bacterium]|nr:carbohydrate kinase family protein [Thermoflexales bacterium]MCS7325290.1 carbohydrate kinase family protein [Thermoflexales bacterium]MCX7938062.1 carbohydrate kinase family protein [Thermoflexales bacterium]MDW8053640.1 carbohydrate kinase family protein [Anaerolineae bacterium]MDW8292507.1 carbohydrate kinase family protein [Anaerolineae bacterium]
MKLLITGSIAYDYLMTFPGSFNEHLLPEHLSRLSVSFLVDTMERRRGGCAPNIAYTLALLGERPAIMATAGQDFEEYRAWLESVGVDTSLVRVVPGKFTASFFCNTDQNNNQIATFYAGAMSEARHLSFYDLDEKPDLVIISPNDPQAMLRYARECRELGIRFIYDPGQQVVRSSGDELRAGIEGANMLICNDYEFEIIRQKTGLTEADVLYRAEALIITRGAKGSTVLLRDHRVDVPAVPARHIADPTGVGDAYRAGFLKGLAVGADWETCARLGSVAATYALEHVGGQSHTFTLDEFRKRYEAHFGSLNGVL